MARKKGLFKLKLRKQTIYSLFALGFFGFFLLTFVSAFYPKGALAKLDVMLDQDFGWGKILVAFTSLQFGLFFSKIKVGLAKLTSIIGFFLIITALLGLSQSGLFGTSIFQTIYSFVPIGFVVFLVLLIV